MFGDIFFGIWVICKPYTGGSGTQHKRKDHYGSGQNPDPAAQDGDKFFGGKLLFVVTVLLALGLTGFADRQIDSHIGFDRMAGHISQAVITEDLLFGGISSAAHTFHREHPFPEKLVLL